MSYLVLANNF